MTNDISKTMRAVTIREPGGADVLCLADYPTPEPADHEVLIKVAAAGINGPDLVQRRGHYPPPEGASELLGLEVSGIVVAKGAKVEGWQIGDTLCALTNGGGYADFVAVDADHCLPIPTGVDLVDAAGLPETYFTVWSNIFHGHTLPEGANLLIHGGAGGIGSTAIQLGAALGFEVFTTVGDKAAADFATELGARRAIDFNTEDFVPILREAGGADVILDIIGGDYIARNIKAARHDGRIVQIAFNAGSKVEINLMPVMLKRLTYCGSTLRSRPPEFKAAVAADVEARVWPMIASGHYKPVTHTVMPLEEAAEAHRLMEASGHRGKILLTM